ncbi:hypothetical protein ACFTWN_00605 [Streptomyces sp. NPDC057092]|uniref:hypothetical protein n=1 Tax=Streptomyces sp. NPDC057092 TaxID=3346017 RepID=UPI003627BBFF
MPRPSTPPSITTDLERGGRWTSLKAGGREWLWRRETPARAAVTPGDAFVDAGGLEECVPTVRGTPDHGDAWTRRWHRDGDTDRVDCERFTLTRRIRVTGDVAEADYTLAADAGFRFVWAAHALLALSDGAVLHMTPGAPTRLHPEAAPLLAEPWPAGAPWREGPWPAPHGLRLDRFGPDDGTAVGAVVDTDRVCVHDGPADRLALSLQADGQPASVALWRNLGGFPEEHPYRSTGVEPMLGRVFDLADAREGDAAHVPASGEVRWRLTLTADCRCP